MSNDKGTDMQNDDAFEALLSQATPRPVPTPEVTAQVRDDVRQEWLAVVGQRNRRQQITRFAIAATVALAAFAAFTTFRPADVADVRVADIERSFGPIYLLGERAELRESPDLLTVMAGQTVVTGAASGIGIRLVTGSSVRIDERTRIEFIDERTVLLHDGRVYVDSDHIAAGAQGSLSIRTAHGVVTHVGTQYIAHVDGRRLTVSVREGRVAIEGNYHDATASPGQQVTLRGSQRPALVNVPTFGEHWSWVEPMAPKRDFDGRPVVEFLEWVSRETGLSFEFESQGAERVAREEALKGSFDAPPIKQLDFWMRSADLQWRIESGVIYISETGP